MDQSRRRRQECRPAGLARALAPNNRSLRLAPRAEVLLRAGVLALAGATAGCSLSFPIANLKTDATPTGSVDRTVATLSPTLDREDVRRAEAALSVALDPQGNGARVGWQNPQTGAHGAFAASGPPFAEHDLVCRAFTGDVAPMDGAERRLTGSACRGGDGSWKMRVADKA